MKVFKKTLLAPSFKSGNDSRLCKYKKEKKHTLKSVLENNCDI